MPDERRARSPDSNHRADDRAVSGEGVPQPHKAWTVLVYLCGDHSKLEGPIEKNLEQVFAAGSTPSVHVVVQRDRPSAHGPAERFIVPEVPAGVLDGGQPPRLAGVPIGSVNTGDGQALLDFLTWGIDMCPSDHVAVLIGGMGLFEAASIFRHGSGRSRLFSICDDESSGDALDVDDLKGVFREFQARRREVLPDAAAPPLLDLLGFDVCHMQFLEVAYELEGLVAVLVGSQTFVPSDGWDYTDLLRAWQSRIEQGTTTATDLARLLVARGAEAYAQHRGGDEEVPARPPLSAIDLTQLDTLTRAFDTFILALMHSLGENLIWWARDRVITYYTRHRPLVRVLTGDNQDFVYDLGALMTALRDAMRDVQTRPLTFWVSDRLRRAREKDQLWRLAPFLARLPLSIREVEPTRLDAALLVLSAVTDGASSEPPTLLDALDQALDESKDPTLARVVESALEHALQTAGHHLRSTLGGELEALAPRQALAGQLAKLTEQLLKVLDPEAGDAGGPVVVARAGDGYSGVSLYRPATLDEVGDLNYLNLEFHKRIHWAAYLAAVNLIDVHPRGLWRLVSAVLSSASPSARNEVMAQLVGENSVVMGLRRQLQALATPAAVRLSLEPVGSRRPNVAIDAGGRAGRRTYLLRLAGGTGGATIAEHETHVFEREMQQLLDQLDTLLGAARAGSQDAERLDGLGRALGEDVLQDLVKRLEADREQARKVDRDQPPHLILQIPGDLMRYPWELMSTRLGWLGEQFALGRQVFTDGRLTRWVPGRRAGRLRLLLIGNPPLRFAGAPAPLQGARAEIEAIVGAVKAFVEDHPDAIDFDAQTDVWLDEDLTGLQFRALLRQKNYDVVHFAGHAAFDANDPEGSAWLFSDGPLTALGMRNTLASLPAPPSLVFANACGGAMDHGEQSPPPGRYQADISGLATAFINQGVAAYIAPLWRVDDGIAGLLAKYFYEELLTNRLTVGLSLRAAKLRVRDLIQDRADGTVRQLVPAAGVGWASFVLYGDPTATLRYAISAPPRSALRPPMRTGIRFGPPSAEDSDGAAGRVDADEPGEGDAPRAPASLPGDVGSPPTAG